MRLSFGVPRNLQPQSDPPLALFRRQGMSVSVPPSWSPYLTNKPKCASVLGLGYNLVSSSNSNLIWATIKVKWRWHLPANLFGLHLSLIKRKEINHLVLKKMRSITKRISFLIRLCLMVACQSIWITFELDKSEREQSFYFKLDNTPRSIILSEKKNAKTLFDNLLLDQIVFDGGDFNRGTFSYRTFISLFLRSEP